MNILGFPTAIKSWLQTLAADDLRTPHGEIMWLIREEAIRRGLGGTLAAPMPELTWTSTYKFEGGDWDPVGLLKDLKGALPIEAPPCPFCKHWNPGRKQWGRTADCCTTPNDRWGDFSCYRPKDDAE